MKNTIQKVTYAFSFIPAFIYGILAIIFLPTSLGNIPLILVAIFSIITLIFLAQNNRRKWIGIISIIAIIIIYSYYATLPSQQSPESTLFIAILHILSYIILYIINIR